MTHSYRMRNKNAYGNTETWLSTISEYPLENLEEEYDYQSDEEQVYSAKKHMVKETIMAIEFFAKEDPLILVDNLKD